MDIGLLEYSVLLFLCMVLIVVLLSSVQNKRIIRPAVKFHYRRKDFLMTSAENDLFDTIHEALDGKFYVFPQIHLSSILDHKIKYQNWEYALRYINQKSIDYLICNLKERKPLLAIELDDWSHGLIARKQRDVNVEYILREAGVPLLRFKNVKTMSKITIVQNINNALRELV